MVTGRYDISSTGLKLIQEFEDFRANAYLDIKGIPTIGYGTTVYPNGVKVKLGDVCTRTQASAWFALDTKSVDTYLDKNVTVKKLTQNQFDALASIIYNIGQSAFSRSTLYRLLKAGDFKGAAEQFLVWDKVTINGKKQASKGLLNRRHKERTLFLKGMA